IEGHDDFSLGLLLVLGLGFLGCLLFVLFRFFLVLELFVEVDHLRLGRIPFLEVGDQTRCWRPVTGRQGSFCLFDPVALFSFQPLNVLQAVHFVQDALGFWIVGRDGSSLIRGHLGAIEILCGKRLTCLFQRRIHLILPVFRRRDLLSRRGIGVLGSYLLPLGFYRFYRDVGRNWLCSALQVLGFQIVILAGRARTEDSAGL